MAGWSFKLMRVSGIAVYVHWTFLLLLAVIAGSQLLGDGNVPMPDRLRAATNATLFVLSIFGCVILHEFGHAFAARFYGIRTKDIYVLPIGGVARLEGMPTSPIQEFVVAIAGPLVNVAIALVLLVILGLGSLSDLAGLGQSAAASLLSHSFLKQLLFANVALVVFNMIPAFPMDGGRVLRAVLAAMLPFQQATLIAARVGQAVAALMAIAGLFGGMPFLLLIAVFVFFGAQAELASANFRARLGGVRVRDAMTHRFIALREHDPVGAVAQAAREGAQRDFPVVVDDQGLYQQPEQSGLSTPPIFSGLITRERLIELLSSGDERSPATPARAIMATDVPAVREDEPLQSAVQHMQSKRLATLPVVRGEGSERRLVGLLTAQAIDSLLDWRESARRGRQTPTTSPIPGR